jgi:hypothetical protein
MTVLRTVRPALADSLWLVHRWSVPRWQIFPSPLPLELWFRFMLCWDLFLGLVGPLWLRDLGKLVWEPLVVSLVQVKFDSSEKNFYRLPFTPPFLSCRLIGPSIWPEIKGGSLASAWWFPGSTSILGTMDGSSAFTGHGEGKWECDFALVQSLGLNLLSVSQLLDEGFQVCLKTGALMCCIFEVILCAWSSPKGQIFKADFSQCVGSSHCLVAYIRRSFGKGIGG